MSIKWDPTEKTVLHDQNRAAKLHSEKRPTSEMKRAPLAAEDTLNTAAVAPAAEADTFEETAAAPDAQPLTYAEAVAKPKGAHHIPRGLLVAAQEHLVEGDGELPKGLASRLSRISGLDQDGNGTIDPAEVTAFAEQHGITLPDRIAPVPVSDTPEPPVPDDTVPDTTDDDAAVTPDPSETAGTPAEAADDSIIDVSAGGAADIAVTVTTVDALAVDTSIIADTIAADTSTVIDPLLAALENINDEQVPQ